MKSAIAYLLFCFYCLGAVFDSSVPTTLRSGNPAPLVRPALFLAVSLYFLAAGSLAFALRLAGLELEQSRWLSFLVAITFLGNYFFTHYYLTQNNRGLLLIEQFAPLVEKNKWVFPVTGLLFFIVSFLIFIFGGAALVKI